MIYAKVILDSISPDGTRIVTIEANYPRFIHSELLTHRRFSRSAASSRAIPIEKVLAQVRNNPAMPVHWGANQKGMQASLQINNVAEATAAWMAAAAAAAEQAEKLAALGLHKQVVNRVLEPFVWMRTIITATEWDNWFELRNHEDAQPEIHALAAAMQESMNNSTPQELDFGEWHMPYLGEAEAHNKTDVGLCKVSAARCARVSYLTHEGRTPSHVEDMALFSRLVVSKPLHASPLEHCATPGYSMTGNFKGWTQFRKLWEAYANSVEVLDPTYLPDLTALKGVPVWP